MPSEARKFKKSIVWLRKDWRTMQFPAIYLRKPRIGINNKYSDANRIGFIRVRIVPIKEPSQ